MKTKKQKITKLPRHNKLIGVGTLSDFKMPIKQNMRYSKYFTATMERKMCGQEDGNVFSKELRNRRRDSLGKYILEATP